MCICAHLIIKSHYNQMYLISIYQWRFEFSLSYLTSLWVCVEKVKKGINLVIVNSRSKYSLNSSRIKTPFLVKHFLMWSKRTKNCGWRSKERGKEMSLILKIKALSFVFGGGGGVVVLVYITLLVFFSWTPKGNLIYIKRIKRRVKESVRSILWHSHSSKLLRYWVLFKAIQN